MKHKKTKSKAKAKKQQLKKNKNESESVGNRKILYDGIVTIRTIVKIDKVLDLDF